MLLSGNPSSISKASCSKLEHNWMEHTHTHTHLFWKAQRGRWVKQHMTKWFRCLTNCLVIAFDSNGTPADYFVMGTWEKRWLMNQKDMVSTKKMQTKTTMCGSHLMSEGHIWSKQKSLTPQGGKWQWRAKQNNNWTNTIAQCSQIISNPDAMTLKTCGSDPTLLQMLGVHKNS